MASERRVIGGKHGKMLPPEQVEAYEKRLAEKRKRKQERKLKAPKPKKGQRTTGERHIVRRQHNER